LAQDHEDNAPDVPSGHAGRERGVPEDVGGGPDGVEVRGRQVGRAGFQQGTSEGRALSHPGNGRAVGQFVKHAAIQPFIHGPCILEQFGEGLLEGAVDDLRRGVGGGPEREVRVRGLPGHSSKPVLRQDHEGLLDRGYGVGGGDANGQPPSSVLHIPVQFVPGFSR
jgi:hypothetical protein